MGTGQSFVLSSWAKLTHGYRSELHSLFLGKIPLWYIYIQVNVGELVCRWAWSLTKLACEYRWDHQSLIIGKTCRWIQVRLSVSFLLPYYLKSFTCKLCVHSWTVANSVGEIFKLVRKTSIFGLVLVCFPGWMTFWLLQILWHMCSDYYTNWFKPPVWMMDCSGSWFVNGPVDQSVGGSLSLTDLLMFILICC